MKKYIEQDIIERQKKDLDNLIEDTGERINRLIIGNYSIHHEVKDNILTYKVGHYVGEFTYVKMLIISYDIKTNKLEKINSQLITGDIKNNIVNSLKFISRVYNLNKLYKK